MKSTIRAQCIPVDPYFTMFRLPVKKLWVRVSNILLQM